MTGDDALLQASAEDLFEHAPCGYLFTALDGTIRRVNRTFLQWSGYARADLVDARHLSDLLSVGGKIYYETHFVPLLRLHGVANEIAFDVVRQDGRRLPVLINASEKRDAAGTPLFHQITVFNAEERRCYERELLHAKNQAAAERDRLRQILDVLPVAVLLVDAAGVCTLINATGHALLGRAAQGQPATAETLFAAVGLRQPDGTPYPLAALPWRRALDQGSPTAATEALINQQDSGRTLTILIGCAPIHDHAAVTVGAVIAFQDVSPLKELARVRDEFLGAAAHDLRTPLTAVRGRAQLVQRHLTRLALPDVAPILRHMDAIEVATRRMRILIDELVDSTRLQIGVRLVLQRKPADLVALVRRVVTQQEVVTRHQLTLETDLAALTVEMDRDRIERVVSNLLDNAVKYSPHGGAIGVRVACEADHAIVAVQDHGLGIPATALPHVFERYYRAENVAGRIQGTGIGLANIREIVAQHGGSVAITSQEGVGTEVVVRLPLHAPPSEE